jgi:hypothetical protein
MESATATAAAVETSASSTAVAAPLGESGRGCANDDERSNPCKKSFEQGGIPHFNSLHLTAASAQAGKPLY